MLRHRFVMAVAAAGLVGVGGCGVSGWEQLFPPEVSLVGADGQQLFYKYEILLPEESSDLSPESLWVVDLTTGISHQLYAPATSRGEEQAWGDYYIFQQTERIGPEESWTDVLYARQISTDELVKVYEPVPGCTYWKAELNQNEVAFLTDDKLLRVYDLVTRDVTQEFQVTADAVSVIGFEGDRVLIKRGDTSLGGEARFIDLTTQEVLDIPRPSKIGKDASDGRSESYFAWSGLSGGWIVGTSGAAEDVESELIEVWGLRLDTQKWKRLGSYRLNAWNKFPPSGLTSTYLAGMNDTHLLLEVASMGGLLEVTIRLELIELDGGKKTTIAEYEEGSLLNASGAWGHPLLEGRKAYWVNGGHMQLNIWDIDTQEERVISLNYPGK